MSKDGTKLRKRRSAKGKGSGKTRPRIVWADLLQRSLTWAVHERIFEKLERHGNTSWLASQLVMLAILLAVVGFFRRRGWL